MESVIVAKNRLDGATRPLIAGNTLDPPPRVHTGTARPLRRMARRTTILLPQKDSSGLAANRLPKGKLAASTKFRTKIDTTNFAD